MIRLRLFGSLDIASDSADTTPLLVQVKPSALLVRLAASATEYLRRDVLVALLWPELDDARGRNALSKAVHLCRRTLGDRVIRSRGSEELGLTPGECWSDVSAFLDATREGRHREALDLYRRGDLLEGFHVAEAAEFERWLDGERDRLRRLAQASAAAGAQAAEQQGDLAGAAEWLGQLGRLAPFDEVIVRRRITLLDRIGDRAGAITAFQALAAALRAELDTEPAPETVSLVEKIRSRSGVRAARPDPVASPLAPPARRHTAWWVGGVVMASALGLAVALSGVRSAPSLEPDRVLVVPFEAGTGDSTLTQLGGLAANWIVVGLSRTGVVKVVDPVTAYYLARDVRTDSALTRAGTEHLGALARASAAGLLIHGDLWRAGDSIVFQVRASDAIARKVLGTVRVATGPDPVADGGLDEVRERVGGLLASRLDVNLRSLAVERTSPPRLDAYVEFIHGLEEFTPGTDVSLPAFLRAARLDTTFMLPIIWARYAAWNSGRRKVVDSLEAVMRDLLEHGGDRLSALDRASFESSVAPTQAGRVEAIRRAARLAPGSNWSYMQGLRESNPRMRLAALEQVNRQHGWAKGWVHLYDQLASAHHMLGDYNRQIEVIREGLAAVPRGWPQHLLWRSAVRALAGLGRIDELWQTLDAAEAEASEGTIERLLLIAGRELAAHERIQDAERVLARGARWIEDHPLSTAYDTHHWHADAAYALGRLAEARVRYDSSAAVAPDSVQEREVRIKAALTFALEGKTQEAGARMERAIALVPSDTVQTILARARLAAALGNGDDAARFFREWRATGRREIHEEDLMHDPAWARIAKHRGYLAALRGD